MKKMDAQKYSELELYKKAIERERSARIKAENLLDSRTIMLNHVNQKMALQYENVNRRNREIMYFNSISQVLNIETSHQKIVYSYLQFTSQLTGWKNAQAFFVKNSKLVPGPVVLKSDDNRGNVYLSEVNDFLIIAFDSLAKDLEDKKFLIKRDVINGTEINYFLTANFVGNELATVFVFVVNSVVDDSHPILDIILNGMQLLNNYFEKDRIQNELKLNISFLKDAQRQLVQSEKMASLGVISAGVAHEINNPICFVLTNIETMNKYVENLNSLFTNYKRHIQNKELLELEKKLDTDYILQDMPALLSETLDGINRVKDIVAGLKAFSHVDDHELKISSVNECVEQALKLTWNELKYKCTVHKNIQEIPEIECYQGQLVQVFTNLIINASHAMEETGNLYIDTNTDGHYIYVKVRDDGVGISEENLKNIFTPFFTTKPTGKGTGLGLSISYGIISKHNGNIEVNSRLGIGTEFIITLPIKKI